MRKKIFLALGTALTMGAIALFMFRFGQKKQLLTTTPTSVQNEKRVYTKNGNKYLVDPEYLVIGCAPFPTPGEDRLIPGSSEDANLDCITSIDEPVFVSAKEGGEFVQDEDLVLGVFYRGEAKAYPVKTVFKHEVVNDKIGDIGLLVTYCPLIGGGVVFESKVQGSLARFGVSGRLYNNDLVMYDRTTVSLWLQVTGEAIAGPLLGERLRQLPVEVVPWETWRNIYPQTQVLIPSVKVVGPAEKFAQIFANYEDTPDVPYPLVSIGEDFPYKSWFRGIVVGGESRAYTEDLLFSKPRINDKVGGKEIVITSEPVTKRVLFYTKEKNELTLLSDIRLYWFSWKSIYPDTTVYKVYNSTLPLRDASSKVKYAQSVVQ